MPSPIIRAFQTDHLLTNLRSAADPIRDLAAALDASLPDGQDKAAGLRKLLEARDHFVRAALAVPASQP